MKNTKKFRVAHLVPWMNVGGTEQVILNLCKFRDKSKIEHFVLSHRQGPIEKEFHQLGIKTYTGTDFINNRLTLLRSADIINVHWMEFKPDYYQWANESGVPFVITQHGEKKLPILPVLTICTSFEAYNIQRDKRRFVVIPNGIDLTKFKAKPKIVKEKIILTRICRPERCALYFWKAMEKVLKQYSNLELWIVGEKGKSTKNIKFLGTRRDIPEILAKTDIFVYTPIPKIGTKDLVIMEAMAMGVPCVAADVNCTRNSMEHKKTGLLVTFGKIDDFAQAVGMLIEDKPLRIKLGKNAQKVARREFDVTKVVRKYEKIYQDVLNNKYVFKKD